jgi:two-component sensor histidine kinase
LWPYTADSAFGAAYRRAVAENIPVQVEAFYPEPLNAWLDVRCYPSPEGLSLFFTDTTARKRDEEKLRETVRAMEAALSEKTVLLKEINHRVKNNLAVIASLLNMQACASENLEARRALDDSQRRVHAMALIHEHLYGSDHLDRIEFSEYARELVEEIYAATIHGRGRISLSFDSNQIELGVHRAVPCALILNELLSNVFKYAFPDGRRGTVSVTLTASTPGSVELAVADDGVGLPPGWENSQSLGWQIVKILTAQLEGSITTEPCSGTHFVLRFPIGSGRCLDPEQA